VVHVELVELQVWALQRQAQFLYAAAYSVLQVHVQNFWRQGAKLAWNDPQSRLARQFGLQFQDRTVMEESTFGASLVGALRVELASRPPEVRERASLGGGDEVRLHEEAEILKQR